MAQLMAPRTSILTCATRRESAVYLPSHGRDSLKLIANIPGADQQPSHDGVSIFLLIRRTGIPACSTGPYRDDAFPL